MTHRYSEGRDFDIVEDVGAVYGNKVSEYDQLELKQKPKRFFSRFIPRIARRRGAPKDNINSKLTNYLDHNEEILQAYIMKSVPSNQLKSWLDKKRCLEHEKAKHSGSQSLQEREDFFLEKAKPSDTQSLLQKRKDFFLNCETNFKQNRNELSSIIDLVHHIISTVAIDAYRVYKIDPNDSNSVSYLVMSPNTDTLNIETELSKAEGDTVKLVWDVATKQECLRLSRGNDSGFPHTPRTLFSTFSIESEIEANHLFYQPVPTIGNTKYVIEMWRIRDKFDDKDEEISANIVVAFHYCNLYIVKQRESNMSDVLLDVVKEIFIELVSLDQLIKRILKSAQELVNAERASLFLVDNINSELVKFDHVQDKNVAQPIRMPINQGIAGFVASNGETLNIPNEYSTDSRFNSTVDMASGYKAKNILCMPIHFRGKVIAVVEMVNKRSNSNFDHEDEIAFEKFSIFFGLALHNSDLYNKIKRNEERYKVALEILSYHNTCKDHEVQEVKNGNCALPNLNNFNLDPYELDNLQKCKAAIKMFDILFDISNFDSTAVTKFILTVKKNYRMVPYHNFDHGWSVAHSMFVILQNDHEQRFDYKMKLALFVACLCHDLDHRGYNNDYLKETEAPLAAMYSSSPLEHHHFSITVAILQQDGHNIFSHLTSKDYKEVLEYIKQSILATDLAVFLPNLADLRRICGKNSDHQSFNWELPNNRNLAMALSMTAADLSASAKPWEIQMKTVDVIFEEFYLQGDKEKEAKLKPIPMMDREKPEEKPTSQVAFLNHICIPCYEMLYKLFPETKPMYETVLQNRDKWQVECVKYGKRRGDELNFGSQ